MEQYWYYIGITFVIFCLYKAYQIFNSEYDKTVPEQDDRKTAFTLEQIAQYNGKNGQKTYVGLNGFVFDVSSSPFYQDGGDYANFAGHDISIACAHHSTEDKYLDQFYDPNNNSLNFS